MVDTDTLEEIADLLTRSQRTLFITGAGISVASGLPTYRGSTGVYQGGVNQEGLPYELVLSGDMLRSRPEVTWRELMRMSEKRLSNAEVNPGHEAIASVPNAVVLTQNVDGLHRKAGSENVIEIHGNLGKLLCTECSYERDADGWKNLTIPPRCPACAGILRPGVVLFGEALPQRALDRLDAELQQGFDMVFTIGTSSLFPYIAEPVVLAAEAGIPTVEINPEETEISHLVRYRVAGNAAEVLPALLR